MSWFGKLVGGLLGFTFGGGPLGAVIGAAFGHQFDKSSEDKYTQGDQERVQAAFFTATFSVMGHLAKVDGFVSSQEIKHAEQVMERMGLNAQARAAAIELFQQGKLDSFDLDGVLHQLKTECGRRKNLMQMFLEVQIGMAIADGNLHAKEEQLLFKVGESLGFGRFMMEQLLRMVKAQQKFHKYSGSSSQGGYSDGQNYNQDPNAPTVEQAYSVLAVKSSDDKITVKRAYRRLMSQHHPDKLVAKGLPEEMIKIATEKTQEIKAAYDMIKSHKGWK